MPAWTVGFESLLLVSGLERLRNVRVREAQRKMLSRSALFPEDPSYPQPCTIHKNLRMRHSARNHNPSATSIPSASRSQALAPLSLVRGQRGEGEDELPEALEAGLSLIAFFADEELAGGRPFGIMISPLLACLFPTRCCSLLSNSN